MINLFPYESREAAVAYHSLNALFHSHHDCVSLGRILICSLSFFSFFFFFFFFFYLLSSLVTLVWLQASSEHSICFAVPEKEVGSVAKALKSRFKRALDAGRLSRVGM
jgi:hypothetical protein